MKELNIFQITKVWYEYKAEHTDLNGNHTDFLFYCLDLNNRLAWKEVFGLPAIETAEFLNISYNTFRKILNDFTEKHKLIRLVEKSTNQYNSNKISLDLLYQNLLKQKQSTYKAFVKAQQKQLAKQSDIDITLLHNNNNTLLHLEKKDYKEIIKSLEFKKYLKDNNLELKKTNSKILKIVYPFQTENFIKIWNVWKQYKKEEHKFSFKSDISEQTALKKLGNDSNNNENTAIEMIENSIANGYKGLFKQQNNGTKKQINANSDEITTQIRANFPDL